MRASRSTMPRRMRRILFLLRPQYLRWFPRGLVGAAVAPVVAGVTGTPVSLSKSWVCVGGLLLKDDVSLLLIVG